MLKICLVGCGRVARSHIEGAKELPDEVEIVALVDRDIENARQFGEQYGVPAVFTSVGEAAKAAAFDAVDLCLPNHLHRQATITCAALGKHILVEKPMANTQADCAAMNEAARAAGVTLMVGQSRRYYPAVARSREMARNGEIGELTCISANLYGYLADAPTPWWRSREQAGGLLIPIWGSHILDYCLWMFGTLPRRVYCESASVRPCWEGEDEAAILLSFGEGRFANIRMSWNTRLKETAWDGGGKMLSSSDILYERYIQGSEGSLYLNDETSLIHNGVPVALPPPEAGNFALQYREFAGAIAEGRTPMASGGEIIRVVQVQQAALRSAAEHRVLELTEADGHERYV